MNLRRMRWVEGKLHEAMKMKQPSFNAYFDRKTGQFVLSRQFEDEHGLNCDTGGFIRYNSEQMKISGLSFAQQHFAEFEHRRSDEPSEFQAMSTEEEARFFLTHDNVWVYRPEPDKIVFWPSQIVKRSGRFVPLPLDPEDTIDLVWPATSQEFFESLMLAFQKVS